MERDGGHQLWRVADEPGGLALLVTGLACGGTSKVLAVAPVPFGLPGSSRRSVRSRCRAGRCVPRASRLVEHLAVRVRHLLHDVGVGADSLVGEGSVGARHRQRRVRRRTQGDTRSRASRCLVFKPALSAATATFSGPICSVRSTKAVLTDCSVAYSSEIADP